MATDQNTALLKLLEATSDQDGGLAKLLNRGDEDPLQKLLRLAALRDVVGNQIKAGNDGSIIDPAAVSRGQAPGVSVQGGGNIPFIIQNPKPNRLVGVLSLLNNAFQGFQQGKLNRRANEQQKRLEPLFKSLIEEALARDKRDRGELL